jgi:uncharacterized protein YxeA
MKGYIYTDIYDRLDEYIKEIKEYFEIKNYGKTEEEDKLYPYKLVAVRFNGKEEELGNGFFHDISSFYDEDDHESYFTIIIKDWFAFKYKAKEIKQIQIMHKQMKIYI